MPQQTALQELIKWGDDKLLKYPNKLLSFSEVLDKAEKLLKKEKKQIIEAYNQGYRDGEREDSFYPENDVSNFDDSINYYNETFNK